MSNGWTKNDIRAFITEQGRVQAYRVPEFWKVREGNFSGLHKNWIPMNVTDYVSVLPAPEWIRIVVAGGQSAIISQFVGPPVELFRGEP